MSGQLPIIHSENDELSLLQTKWAPMLNTLLKANGKAPSVKVVTQAYGATASDYVLFCSAKTAFPMFLPAATLGNSLILQKTDTSFSQVTIQGPGLKTTLNTQGETVWLVADGTNWQVLDRYIPSIATSYTPTVAGLGTGSTSVNSAIWHREGPYLYLAVSFKVGVAGTGASSVTWSLPSGLTRDNSVMVPTGATINQVDGIATLFGWTGAASFTVTSGAVNSATAFSLIKPATGGSFTGADALLNATADMRFRLPIVGWNG